MNTKSIAFFSWILIFMLAACSPGGLQSQEATFSPTRTRIPATSSPTTTLTPTLSPTITSTSTPITPDLELVGWTYSTFLGKTYYAGVVRNNSDFGIVAPLGGTLAFECDDGLGSGVALTRVPPVAPHAEAGFLEEYTGPEECRKVKKASITYETEGMLLSDANHEIPDWKTEVMKESWENYDHSLKSSYVTVENTSHYPCLLEDIVTLAFDNKDNIIGIGTTKFFRENMDLPIPPHKKMGFSATLDKTAYDQAAKLEVYPIAKGYGFCENPDAKAHPGESSRAPLPERMEVIQVGGWGDPRTGYSHLRYYAFTVKNNNIDSWNEGLSWHADLYDGDGRLLGISEKNSVMSVPPMSIGAGWDYFDVVGIEAAWKKEYHVEVFVYSSRFRRVEIDLPLAQNITWFMREDIVNVSCTLYNPKSYTLEYVDGAVGIVYDRDQNIVGAGGADFPNLWFALKPEERVEVSMVMYTSIHPERIEIYPAISLSGRYY